jgi:cobalamin biosynthesis protein CobD/CbiB
MKKINSKIFENTEGSQSGFLQIIGIVIIAAIVLAFLGYNVKELWVGYGLPIFEWIWNVLVTLITFAIDVVVKAVNIFRTGDYPSN